MCLTESEWLGFPLFLCGIKKKKKIQHQYGNIKLISMLDAYYYCCMHTIIHHIMFIYSKYNNIHIRIYKWDFPNLIG